MDKTLRVNADKYLNENGFDYKEAFYKLFEQTEQLKCCGNCEFKYSKGNEIYCTKKLEQVKKGELDSEWVRPFECCSLWKQDDLYEIYRKD